MKTNSYLDNLSSFSSPSPSTSPPHQKSCRNVFKMLSRREIDPRIKKCLPRKDKGENFDHNHREFVKSKSESVRDSRRELLSWVEAESLKCLSAKYCSLTPSPRSTIAAAFSPDGKILASTHGDHTVKIIDCLTGKCLKVLNGHRRTPWVVRFHPLRSEILVSGSLDHEVRIWNAKTSECIGSRDFCNRPIASIAFHSEGELLAVAAGHKLYLWEYNNRGENSSPAIILRTRRSLRAVHFHPHSAPLLLTAEVNDLDASDSTMAPPTASLGYLHHPPPAPYIGNMHRIDRQSLAAELPLMPLPLFPSPSIAVTHSTGINDTASNMDISGIEEVPEFRQDLLTDRVRWELPFMQGWLMGHNQAGMPYRYSVVNNDVPGITSLAVESANTTNDGTPMISRMSQISASLTASAELPCTVKLKIWSHDPKNPFALLKADRCRLTIPHAVLCSEMGAHFSPCGRYLAACVACVLPHFETDSGMSTQLHQDTRGAGTSPTRHPISARQLIYELRIYSLEEPTFGSVLISRPIRAAHCLTSIQFSPSSEHILLAYGRRHSSLLKSVDINGNASLSVYTVLEVYRVSDMEIVSVLPSAEDEVNVACFHPFSGGGIVYGTKEGKLRILQFDDARGMNVTTFDHFSKAQMMDEE